MAASLKKHLQSLTSDELVAEILKLVKRFKDVKTYFDMELGDSAQQAAIVEGVKQQIKKQFFPARGYGNPKAAEVRKLISDFRKVSVFPFDVVDVLLYRVEQAVDFTNAYGDIDETFYTSAESAYEDALKLMSTHNLKDHFRNRCRTIQQKTDGIGWGFGDEIGQLTEQYLNE